MGVCFDGDLDLKDYLMIEGLGIGLVSMDLAWMMDLFSSTCFFIIRYRAKYIPFMLVLF